jgi:hypothetical protein
MKRSEMLKTITSHFLNGIDFDAATRAENLLSTLEILGMQPPIIEEESWKLLDSGELTYAVHEWELENAEGLKHEKK